MNFWICFFCKQTTCCGMYKPTDLCYFLEKEFLGQTVKISVEPETETLK